MEFFELRNGCPLTVQRMYSYRPAEVLTLCSGCSVRMFRVFRHFSVGFELFSRCRVGFQWLGSTCSTDVWRLSGGCLVTIQWRICYYPTHGVLLSNERRRTYSLMDPLRLSHGCPLLVPDLSLAPKWCFAYVCLTVQGVVSDFYAHTMDVFSVANKCYCPTDVLPLSVGCPRVV